MKPGNKTSRRINFGKNPLGISSVSAETAKFDPGISDQTGPNSRVQQALVLTTSSTVITVLRRSLEENNNYSHLTTIGSLASRKTVTFDR
jgi:hypothetical protein